MNTLINLAQHLTRLDWALINFAIWGVVIHVALWVFG